MSASLRNKLDRLEAKIQPHTDLELEEQKRKSEEIQRLCKELIEFSRLEEIDDAALTPQQRNDKALAEAEYLSLHRYDYLKE